MTKKLCLWLLVSVVITTFISCKSGGEDIARPEGDGWLIYPVVSGGVPKDGIPALTNPKTVPPAEATYLTEDALVIGIVVNGEARAYPHAIMDWHEIVNEDFPAKPLAITYCPLTGTSIVFERTVNGRVLSFGVSGLLHNSNLIMFDRQTDSHWTQMRLQCDQGEFVGTKLRVYPAIETTWKMWKRMFPNTLVLSTDTGYDRNYFAGQSYYAVNGYSNIHEPPWFAVTPEDRRLPPKVRVHGVIYGDTPENHQSKAYVIAPLQEKRVINDSIANRPILVIDDGMDSFIVSYSRVVSDRMLTFRLAEDASNFPFHVIDSETGSTWNLLGEAIAGPLKGARLQATLSYNAYWFAWGAFHINSPIHEN